MPEEVEMRTSRVNEAAILRQAVLNTSQSIELLREAVSNSVDADARRIDVKLENSGGDLWTITIVDDGNGMEERHMEAFFNAGQTEKDFDQALVIGEKGLGSKTSFVADLIEIESRRKDRADSLLIGTMHAPMAALRNNELPQYTVRRDPPGYPSRLPSHGTRIVLEKVRLNTFNGKKTNDPDEIAERIMHYLRTMCATGTVKNRHAHRQHVKETVVNVGVIPDVTVEVASTGHALLGPTPGAYPVPEVNLMPATGPEQEGIQQRSKHFCDIYDFTGSKTISVLGNAITVHYEGTAIVAGDLVREKMLKGELKQGWTHKSQMGVHLCKDFIPLRSDASLSRELLDSEYFYEFKVFLNCQTFELNADRNVVTNRDSDEISWIWNHFRTEIWPSLQAKVQPYKDMSNAESSAIDAIRKTRESELLKSGYSELEDLAVGEGEDPLEFVKVPLKEADVSHLLAMMLQHGGWVAELAPMTRFGQYINASTDALVEDASGNAQLVEVEYQLPNLFKHKHPMTSYDAVVVWGLGGMTNGQTSSAPWGSNGKSLTVTLLSHANGGWTLKWGTHQTKVYVLSEILRGDGGR